MERQGGAGGIKGRTEL
jgi:hypothetical protein